MIVLWGVQRTSAEHTYVEVHPSNLVEVIQFLITILCGRGDFDNTEWSVRWLPRI